MTENNYQTDSVMNYINSTNMPDWKRSKMIVALNEERGQGMSAVRNYLNSTNMPLKKKERIEDILPEVI